MPPSERKTWAAQLGERRTSNLEIVGSNPTSTIHSKTCRKSLLNYIEGWPLPKMKNWALRATETGRHLIIEVNPWGLVIILVNQLFHPQEHHIWRIKSLGIPLSKVWGKIFMGSQFLDRLYLRYPRNEMIKWSGIIQKSARWKLWPVST